MTRRRIEDISNTPECEGFRIKWLWVFLGALWIAAIIAVLVVFRGRIADLQHYGYLGAFLISLMASATIVTMIPSVPVIFALGGILNPFFVALSAAFGETIGESTSYLAGRTGSAFLIRRSTPDDCEPTGIYARLQRWMRVKGSLALFLSAAIFNPFFSVVGATAGALRLPPWKFYLVVFAGKMIKWTVVAILGRALLKYVLDWLGISL